MKRLIHAFILASALFLQMPAADIPYSPTAENLRSRKEFSDARFGIFLHWGIYSMFGQGEWYLNYGPTADEYAKAASGFYPASFDADQWVKAIADSGAKYICITSRHHDGFSMWDTQMSDYNIVRSTPFRRDVLKELADACQHYGIRLHFYYSHLDWTRPDYPKGRTGHDTGRPEGQEDWKSYYDFMNGQLTELLTEYGPIGAIWFDGYWDHDEDATPFDWQLREQYDMIHRLQPACLIGNNHHEDVKPGEDIQIFERDVPGENSAGYSTQQVSQLPLETCQTMNGMWGYKIKDQDYKSTDELIQYLVRTAGKGANLLLNIGPQPSGELPATALDRLHGIGEWMRTNGKTIYGTTAADFPEQPWGTATLGYDNNSRKADRLWLHVLKNADELKAYGGRIFVPTSLKVTSAEAFATGEKLRIDRADGGYIIHLPHIPEGPDFIVTLKL